MIIIKDNKQYTVEDRGSYWLLRYSIGKIDAEFRIDKSLAQDYEALKDKVMTDEAF